MTTQTTTHYELIEDRGAPFQVVCHESEMACFLAVKAHNARAAETGRNQVFRKAVNQKQAAEYLLAVAKRYKLRIKASNRIVRDLAQAEQKLAEMEAELLA